MGKRSASALLVMTIAAGLLGLSAGSASATATESGFVSRINAERRSRGMRALTVRLDLVNYGRKHSREMAASGGIYHTGNLAGAIGGNWTELGENVGVGPDVPTLHQAFMNSPTHRDNVLHRAYNEVGVGVAYADGRMYVTVMFAARNGGSQTTSSPARPARSAPAQTNHFAHTASGSAPRPVRAEPAPEPRTVSLLERLIGD